MFYIGICQVLGETFDESITRREPLLEVLTLSECNEDLLLPDVRLVRSDVTREDKLARTE